MITELILQFVLAVIGALYLPVVALIPPLKTAIDSGLLAVGVFLQWAVNICGYFVQPDILKAALLFIPAYVAALCMVHLTRYIINLVRGAGA